MFSWSCTRHKTLTQHASNYWHQRYRHIRRSSFLFHNHLYDHWPRQMVVLSYTLLYFKEGCIVSFNITVVLVRLYLKFLAIFESGNILEYNRERCSAVREDRLWCTIKFVWSTSARMIFSFSELAPSHYQLKKWSLIDYSWFLLQKRHVLIPYDASSHLTTLDGYKIYFFLHGMQ